MIAYVTLSLHNYTIPLMNAYVTLNAYVTSDVRRTARGIFRCHKNRLPITGKLAVPYALLLVCASVPRINAPPGAEISPPTLSLAFADIETAILAPPSVPCR